ncbi:hypothetical protein H5T88_02030 [bacterium]|nr:hypothetical protein [bacterium]
MEKLKDARLNGFLLAKELPSESVLVFTPDGTATFFYYDTFLRHYRGRKQILSNKIENFLSRPISSPLPKFLKDVYSMNVSALYFNDWEDILWWTGELVYKFEFPFPIKSLNLSSPEGSLITTVGDWEWEKVGRAIWIYASADAENWTLMWKSPPPGGVTQVKAELPQPLIGSKTIYLKFVGQNNNVLYDLYITAKLDARSVLPLLKLKRGPNTFRFSYNSIGKCLLSFEGVQTSSAKRVYPKKIKIDVESESVAISFPQGVAIQLMKEGEHLKGIQKLFIGNYEVEDNDNPALPTLKVFSGSVEKIKDWRNYLLERDKNGDWVKRGNGKVEEVKIERCFYKGYEINGDVVIIKSLIESEKINGELYWVFIPSEKKIGRRIYKGLSYKLIFRNLRCQGKPFEVVIEEKAKWWNGDWFINQSWGDFKEVKLSFLSILQLPPMGYFAWQQPFLFYGGANRAIVSFFNDVVYAKVGVNQEMDKLIINSSIPLKNGETTMKCWLVGEGKFPDKWSILNEWSEVFDYLGGRYRSLYGLKRIEPKPALLWQGYDDAFDRYKSEGKLDLEKSWLWRFADDKLPILGKLGIRILYLAGGIWESDAEYPPNRYLEGSKCFGSGCAPWHLEISPALGGEEALAHLCNEAHKRGIKVLIWSTPAHLSNSSPLLLEHPEWIAQEADGIPVTWYNDVFGVSLYGGYFLYAINRYKAIRSLGIDGYWQDSFLTFGVLTDFSQPNPYPQLERTIKMQKAMQEMGYSEIHIEGCGPFGLSSGGYGYGDNSYFEKIKGKEYGLYYYVADTIFDKEAYFRALASKGVLGILSLDRLSEEDKNAIAEINNGFNIVAPYMEKRRLLGMGDDWFGVEWRNKEGKTVLFSFKRFSYKLGRRTQVEDVTTKKRMQIKDGQLVTQPWHIYLIP